MNRKQKMVPWNCLNLTTKQKFAEMQKYECEKCGDFVEAIQSTSCGRMCPDCLTVHCEVCDYCANDFACN